MSDNDNKKEKTSAKPTPVMAAFLESESVLRSFIRRFTNNHYDIDDYTQETILRALTAEQKKPIDEPRAYLFGIAKNIARRNFEKKSKNIISFIEDLAPKEYVSNEPSLERHIESREEMTVFAEAIATLPSQCQKVFVLKKVYGYTHKEIAKQLGISTNTTEKHVAAGLKRCSEFMDQRKNDDEKLEFGSSPHNKGTKGGV